MVSVIIPTYRGDRFIESALSDIAAQTWPRWELIVVEDGSQGETESIVRQFAAAHPGHRVEYLRHPQNISQSAARNTGARNARGTHIALLDVDDHWQPTHLAASLAALQNSRADLAYSTVITFDDRTGILTGTWGPTNWDLKNFPFSLLHHCFITPSSVVFQRELLTRVGAFEPTIRQCEDMDFWLRCAAANVQFVYVKGCQVLYRKNHSESQTSGTCRMTESYARVVERHKSTFKNAPQEYYRLAAKAYFSAAWCHATTNPSVDPTADPSRAPALLRRACELHRRKVKYWIHSALLDLCERTHSKFLRNQFVRWFKPRKFIRVGQLIPTA